MAKLVKGALLAALVGLAGCVPPQAVKPRAMSTTEQAVVDAYFDELESWITKCETVLLRYERVATYVENLIESERMSRVGAALAGVWAQGVRGDMAACHEEQSRLYEEWYDISGWLQADGIQVRGARVREMLHRETEYRARARKVNKTWMAIQRQLTK